LDTNTYVQTEADPVWTAASNLYYQRTEADGLFATGTPLYAETYTGDFKADGSAPMTGTLNMGGQRITNVSNVIEFGGDDVAVGRGPMEDFEVCIGESARNHHGAALVGKAMQRLGVCDWVVSKDVNLL
jgi:hypothetical protein